MRRSLRRRRRARRALARAEVRGRRPAGRLGPPGAGSQPGAWTQPGAGTRQAPGAWNSHWRRESAGRLDSPGLDQPGAGVCRVLGFDGRRESAGRRKSAWRRDRRTLGRCRVGESQRDAWSRPRAGGNDPGAGSVPGGGNLSDTGSGTEAGGDVPRSPEGATGPTLPTTPPDPAARRGYPLLTADGMPKLTRTRDGAVVAGVAAGLARHLNIKVVWIRTAFAVGAVMAGAGILFYALLWIFVPLQGENGSAPAQPDAGRASTGDRNRRRGSGAAHRGDGVGLRSLDRVVGRTDRRGCDRGRLHLAGGRRRPARPLAPNRGRCDQPGPGHALAGARRGDPRRRRLEHLRHRPTRLRGGPVRLVRGRA